LFAAKRAAWTRVTNPSSFRVSENTRLEKNRTPNDSAMTMIVPYHPLVGPVTGFAAVLFGNQYNTNFPLYSVDASWLQRFELRALGPDAGRAADAAAAAFKG
jgi:hypothetical protein